MKKTTIAFVTIALAMGAAAPAVADDHGGELEPATPVELYPCSYREGMDYGDLEAVIDEWTEWADDTELTDYSAWTMVPWYSGENQDFDVAWLGGAETAAALGAAQDDYIANGRGIAARFEEVLQCDAHSAFAVLEFREPPERENPDNLVISFSDCTLAEGTGFNDLVPSIMQWANYRGDNGSTAGMWTFMPAMGGGGEAFDFKWVTAHQNLEDMGKDFDQYSQAGWEKAEELFMGKVDCDSSRVYLATNHRRAESDD